MSTGPQPAAGRAPATLRCPRCGAEVGPEQDWCLDCGAPARTRLAPTPNWRLPIAALAVVVLLAGLALAAAFTSLTSDDGRVDATTPLSAPVQPDETAAQSVPTAPPITATSPSGSAPASSSTP
ncbi:hypothetical protein FSW04_21845 [Baekduia soli]|uniref:Zinc ribbon domain-containing protein n=1 Tax=Baekduia soli TaxID=496014 RepID=A0A5B8U9U5_9ACTN|nr:hypothetical protein [Baekduia soli]QEC49946.1 hypothetical protein FSW04_21845 [Baekduia soli]